MANDFAASVPEYWKKMLQSLLLKTAVYPKIARRKEEAELNNGDIVHFPYGNKVAVRTVASTGAVGRGDTTITDDSLTVDQWKAITRFIDNKSKIQSNYNLRRELAMIDTEQAANFIDARVLAEVRNVPAANVVDAGSVGGSAGSPIDLTTSNVWKVVTAVGEKLNAQNAQTNIRCGVISPYFINILDQYRGGKESGLGDRVSENGFLRNLYGMDLYMSNNLLFEARLNFGSTNASDGDTFTINGVVFTFETSTLDAVGKIDVGSTVAETCDQVVVALNDPFTASAGVYAAQTDSEANRLALEGLFAVDGTTYVSVYVAGGSDIAVSETFASADITFSKQVQHNFFGVKEKVSLVIQKEPNVEYKDRSGDTNVYLGKDLITEFLFGTTLFDELAKEVVDVQINVA